ncbi:squalene synthase-like [Paramacrobiotus metropolitanus]|uniref:squalene synthase-like n=1 Tax=Paramacrobiotus metropolitanus TaxID=2943436 RepID=UPI002445CBE1|nr:squalene synthase-like [Paramacrobiotus metropolitanus]
MERDEKELCYQMLNQTGRSFSMVIATLGDQFQYSTCIFYLVIRALDTVEDDMTIPLDTKLLLLRTFQQKLYVPGWNYRDSRSKDAVVLHNFHVISSQFRRLDKAVQCVISDTCRRMAAGMAIFLEKGFVIDTFQEWNEYGRCASGLMCLGLTRLLEPFKPISSQREQLAHSLGRFLQKMNIIRDFKEDTDDRRRLWPREVLVRTGNTHLTVDDLLQRANQQAALRCLNYLIGDALTHLPDVLLYLNAIQTPTVFPFWAIPQVMAIATLERCYNNPQVFEGKVKILRGGTAMIVQNCTDMATTKDLLRIYALKIVARMECAGSSDEAKDFLAVLKTSGVLYSD